MQDPDRPQTAGLRDGGRQLGAGHSAAHPGLEHRDVDTETLEQSRQTVQVGGSGGGHACPGVSALTTSLTGTPRARILPGRPSASQRDSLGGSVETITSSNPISFSASRAAMTGSAAPRTATTSDRAARVSSGTAVAMRRSASKSRCWR